MIPLFAILMPYGAATLLGLILTFIPGYLETFNITEESLEYLREKVASFVNYNKCLYKVCMTIIALFFVFFVAWIIGICSLIGVPICILYYILKIIASIFQALLVMPLTRNADANTPQEQV